VQEDLTDFLNGGTKLCEAEFAWGNGSIPLHLTYSLSGDLPPAEYVSSVRAILFRGDQALVVTNHENEKYIFPGGRVEEGETFLDTLSREVLEETGWTFTNPQMLGYMHFHHLGEKPDNYRYPYPDFIWPIFTAEADRFETSAIQPDDYVRESCFRPVKEVFNLPLEEGQLLLLKAALRRR